MNILSFKSLKGYEIDAFRRTALHKLAVNPLNNPFSADNFPHAVAKLVYPLCYSGL